MTMFKIAIEAGEIDKLPLGVFPGEIKVISDIMGHANVTTTMNIYIPPDQDSRENARRNIVSGSLFSAETSR